MYFYGDIAEGTWEKKRLKRNSEEGSKSQETEGEGEGEVEGVIVTGLRIIERNRTSSYIHFQVNQPHQRSLLHKNLY